MVSRAFGSLPSVCSAWHNVSPVGEHGVEYRPPSGLLPDEGDFILQKPVRLQRATGLHQALGIGPAAGEHDHEKGKSSNRADWDPRYGP